MTSRRSSEPAQQSARSRTTRERYSPHIPLSRPSRPSRSLSSSSFGNVPIDQDPSPQPHHPHVHFRHPSRSQEHSPLALPTVEGGESSGAADDSAHSYSSSSSSLTLPPTTKPLTEERLWSRMARRQLRGKRPPGLTRLGDLYAVAKGEASLPVSDSSASEANDNERRYIIRSGEIRDQGEHTGETTEEEEEGEADLAAPNTTGDSSVGVHQDVRRVVLVPGTPSPPPEVFPALLTLPRPSEESSSASRVGPPPAQQQARRNSPTRQRQSTPSSSTARVPPRQSPITHPRVRLPPARPKRPRPTRQPTDSELLYASLEDRRRDPLPSEGIVTSSEDDGQHPLRARPHHRTTSIRPRRLHLTTVPVVSSSSDESRPSSPTPPPIERRARPPPRPRTLRTGGLCASRSPADGQLFARPSRSGSLGRAIVEAAALREQREGFDDDDSRMDMMEMQSSRHGSTTEEEVLPSPLNTAQPHRRHASSDSASLGPAVDRMLAEMKAAQRWETGRVFEDGGWVDRDPLQRPMREGSPILLERRSRGEGGKGKGRDDRS